MTSIFENTKSKVTVHILHDDTLTEDNRKKFIRTAEKYSQGLELHDVTEHKKNIGAEIEKLLGKLTVATLFRLIIPDILKVNKVIYLDCDVLVCLDILELWKIDTEGYHMAASLDNNTWLKSRLSSWRVRCFLNGYNSHSYVNAGVLLMNLAEIRKDKDFFSTAIKWLCTHIHIANCFDQDALNSIFTGSIKIIDNKFNAQMNEPNALASVTEADKIIHFAGKDKAWEMSGESLKALYWKFYLLSTWGESISREKLIDSISYYTRPIAPECRLFSRKTRQIFDVIPEAISSIKLILRDLYYRIKYRLTRR